MLHLGLVLFMADSWPKKISQDIPYKMEVVHANSSDSSMTNGQPKVRVLPKALVMKVSKDVEAVKPECPGMPAVQCGALYGVQGASKMHCSDDRAPDSVEAAFREPGPTSLV